MTLELTCRDLGLQILREVPADEVAHSAVAVSRTGRVVFTGTTSGTVRAVKYPLPTQKEWLMYQAHCAPVTKVSLDSNGKSTNCSESNVSCVFRCLSQRMSSSF